MTTATELLAWMTDVTNGYTVLDVRGSRLVVGSRIAPYDANGVSWPGGVVIQITDPDGDVTDEGRSIAIDPTVTVAFDDGTQDTFTTYIKSYAHWDSDEPVEFASDELVRER